ncbi:hypothetical protein GTQ40_05935 [Flavobacteriaceae bacterium R38]|nr:hypothetical protein [Flavobacteriaceae bacterium R38]
MKYFTGIGILFLVLLWSCSTSNKVIIDDISEEEKLAFNSKEGDTVRIANDSIEYEIIIIDPGFNIWLNRVARQRGYYTQGFLETRNNLLVTNYNIRVRNPFRYDPELYPLEIDYQPGIDYGYEVNYLLYNYFIFFQRRNNQQLTGFVPRA